MQTIRLLILLGCAAGVFCDAFGAEGILGVQQTRGSTRGGASFSTGQTPGGGSSSQFVQRSFSSRSSGGGQVAGTGSGATNQIIQSGFSRGGGGGGTAGGGFRTTSFQSRSGTAGGGVGGFRTGSSVQSQGTGRTSSRSAQSAFAAAGLQGFGSGDIDINNFGNIDASAFGFDAFGNLYINVEAFDFNAWRNAAAAQAPREALSGAQTEQVVIGSRFRSGYARQHESSSSEKSGSGSGEAGIELSASRQASQDATQQYTQTASGEGNTEQGAAYGYQRTPNLQFQAIKLESLPVHSGPRSQVPRGARRSFQG